jgi:ketosteroid isomerase-like protein
MSEKNVEVIRRLYRAMDARDLQTFAELTHPALEWIPDERVGEGPVRGRENVIRFFSGRAEIFEDLRTETEAFWEADDRVVAFVRVTGLGTGSGAGFEIRIAHLWTLSEGLIERGEGYGDRDQALEAAGLSE